MYLPRIHVASIETCGCVADYHKVDNHLTMYMTTQAPHAIRTVIALVAGHVGLTEEKVRVISPDIGGGFGGKVPVYPGYVIAIAVSFLTGAPVKWIEDRSENLQADSFARDYYITAELADQEGRDAHRTQDQDHRRPRLHRRGGQSLEVPGGCSNTAPAPMTSRPLMLRWMASIPTNPRGASPTAVPFG